MTSVMIVDDELFIVELYRDILQLRGYRVVGTAFDGEEALKKYSSTPEKPDVIIMDHRIPVMNGVEATRRILANDPKTRIIGLSMHADRDMAVAMRDAGAVAYMTKGGPSQDLIAAIRAC